MAEAGAELRGAVFTRREVVDFILDLAGYTTDKPLHRARVLEPSMGQGDFLSGSIQYSLQETQERLTPPQPSWHRRARLRLPANSRTCLN